MKIMEEIGLLYGKKSLSNSKIVGSTLILLQ